MPSQEIAELLKIDPQQPIIEKRTRSFLDDGTVFEYSRNQFTTTDYKFTLISKRHSNTNKSKRH
ncbi:UTRA domain-containing protein [Psychromonas sp. KJ10-10]|uniref:UTRA domain-containing protein n=1 Tax=Psychromonas sp. KJ10-10 TaxID=3391823 RepID=UPI0039B4CABA